jgi:hypothetical protein
MVESANRKNHKTDKAGMEFSDINVDTRRSKNSPVAIGNNIIQNFEAQQKPIDFQPYEENDLSLIGIGESLMRRFYGTLNHDLNKWILYTLIASIISGGTIYAPYVPGTPVPIGSHYYVPFSLAGFIGLLLALLLGWGPIGIAKQTECPNCLYKFSFFNVQKTMTNRAELSDGEVRNFRIKKVCNNCGYSKTVKRVQHIPYEAENN